MQLPLNTIATLIPGTHMATVPYGKGFMLQPRHFDTKGNLSEALEPTVMVNSKKDRYRLHAGDVLLTAKGNVPFAIFYDGYPEPAFAASAFIIIRLNEEQKIIPAYLCWYLNHPHIQRQLTTLARGTDMLAIPKSELELFTVSVPPIFKQELIVALANRQALREALQLKILQLEEKQLQYQLFTHTQ